MVRGMTLSANNTSTRDFSQLGISSAILQALHRQKIVMPTPIQQQSIPMGLDGKDILGIAQTGTGKTLAFGIPVLQGLDRFAGRALVLVPTRELAQQVAESLMPLARALHIRLCVLMGGASMSGQIRDLAQKPRLLIATPGRLIDHLQQGRLKLDDVSFLVLDEADRMLDMGFAPQIQQILRAIPKKRQTFLFSATMPSTLLKIATAHMTLPVHVEVAVAGTTASDIEQEIFMVSQESKLSLLERILQDYQGTVLVFARTKHGAKKITHVVRLMGHSAAEIHSNRSQAQRREALSGFKSGRYRILVATDIAARGIDVQNIELVVNFDLPDNSDDYVHRIGRTGRAGQKGKAVSFVTPRQKHGLRTIERLIRKTLTIKPLPAWNGADSKVAAAATQVAKKSANPETSRPAKTEAAPSRPKSKSHRFKKHWDRRR